MSNTSNTKGPFYIGVDVGTGSVRACLINNTGKILSLCEDGIEKQELIQEHITQSSTEIWNKICFCVRDILKQSLVDISKVKGIGFDATCSLVVVDKTTHEPIAVGPNFLNSDQNIILWMDHRAPKQTDFINKTGHKCLKYVGGKMSIEMEIPKIKWLKDNLPTGTFERCKFYDLSDFLTFKATGNQAKSLCAAACKQGFLPYGVEGSITGWSPEFLMKIGLEELVENDFAKLGGPLTSEESNRGKSRYLSAGNYIAGLCNSSSIQLGLTTECIVGSGIIDAYAGWVGTVAAVSELDQDMNTNLSETKSVDDAIGRLAVVAGTSTCHITLSRKPYFAEGVWGPYKDILIKNFWCAEGGQSCTGELLAHILSSHPAYGELKKLAKDSRVSVYDYLNTLLADMVNERGERSILALGKHIFFYGDLHGNRSPLADATMTGSIIGLTMDTTINDLALKYLVTCEFISQQTRHIIEKMTSSGHHIKALYMSGGQCRNSLLMDLLTNATGYPVVIPRYIDSAVVFGAALLGASASNTYEQNNNAESGDILWDTMRSMTKSSKVIKPAKNGSADRLLLEVKYKIYLRMAQEQKDYRTMVDTLEEHHM
ncbi:similar to Saccharomyces cerevisiae YDR109C Putative kinase [Maudiozyma barnettii]|uniref:Similar to Saccharomyces cerevisiae YDR109C Putative kinase n=1 Tax=Maudiozyma barnettii TaxID=61262 RepID=A0A8H2VHD1_9SACH|nr:putative phosphotransferase [Kazachstania barnettii]CAB4255701.1 similar to Saccharomyces cerevisiae YDR109C Putative kinase [Kazachstania barnettii]CAD1784262.1 similar to Saccharomyces cerevisiae YDR109C Putative kinase [Kazachstania barnettii]